MPCVSGVDGKVTHGTDTISAESQQLAKASLVKMGDGLQQAGFNQVSVSRGQAEAGTLLI